MTIEFPRGRATAKAAAARLGVAQIDLDPQFGVVLIDPKRRLYAVLLDEAIARRVARRKLPGVAGPHANPRVATFD